jgi:Ser/Thr protein kinase RdoA (MazF antagonist)
VQLDPKGTRDIRELTSRLLVELEVIQKLRSRNLPQGIGHGDLFPDNVLFPRKLPRINGTQRLKGPVGYVLDLEQAATMPLVYDVAVALLAFCAPVPLSDATSASHDADERNQPEERVGPLRVDVSRALLDGYQQLRVLADAEWQALPMELRLAAARFTTTRLTDIQGLGERPATTELPPSTSGAMGAATNPTPDSAAPAPQPAEAGPPGLGLGPVHSKDYRDFAQRLALLQATSPEALITTLRDA